MKHGKTIAATTGSFSFRDSFDIPAGTPVKFGQRDCEGNPFRQWALDEKTAAALSGNAWDAAHRFVTVSPDNVEESE